MVPMTAAEGEASTPDGVEIASLPWAFTQQHPLDTSDFIKEAGRRGVSLDEQTLRALYKHNLLSPVVALMSRPVAAPSAPRTFEPQPSGGRLRDLRTARDAGHLVDLTTVPYKERLRFERPPGAVFGWWNGLLYSQYQLLGLRDLRPALSGRRVTRRGDKRYTTLPQPHQYVVNAAARYRRIALAVTALEARYLPRLDPERLHLSGVGSIVDEWKEYRDGFDPVTFSATLDYRAADVRADAESLLSIAHRHDPVGDSWGLLIRRAPQESWKQLRDAALETLDLRIAAEILLCFYEDLAVAGLAEPLPDFGEARMGWHPLLERLSYRRASLDRDLMSLGISPHPRVVLAIEGKTEQLHVPRVWRALELPDAPELLRVITLGGVAKDPVTAGMLAATPLLEGQGPGGDFYWGSKPPTCYTIAVDPEGRYYGSPAAVADTKAKILTAVKEAIEAQGAEVADSELDGLVEIHTWSASCYEFAHFTDEELAAGITAIHTICNGLSREALVAALSAERARKKDIKEVWSQWDYEPNKIKLAEELWPVLEKKIIAARSGDDVPEIAEVLYTAYLKAQRWRHHSFVWPVRPDPASAT